MKRITDQTTLPDAGIIPVKPVRLYAQVVDQVLDLLRGGSLVPGDRLPSERELAARFEISRASLRQALTAIEVSGYIEIRPGSGTYVVATPEPRQPGLSVGPLDEVAASAAPLEILEARALVEPGVAQLAAERRTDSDLTVMRELVDRMADAIDAGIDGWDADWGFHAALGAATKNASIEAFASAFQQQMEQPVWSLMRARNLEHGGRARGYVRDHEQIFQAIEDGDGELAARAMTAHIEHVIEDLDSEELKREGGGVSE